MILDVTRAVLHPSRLTSRISFALEVKAWLTSNVGLYQYEDHRPRGNIEDNVYVGDGWEFIARATTDDDNMIWITWLVDIADEQAAILFALRWL
jgi:hypothetical protein